MNNWPRWAIYAGAVGMLFLAGIGACYNYLGPIDLDRFIPAPQEDPEPNPDPNPSPNPEPSPEPIPGPVPEPLPPPKPNPDRPDPSEVWRPLVAPDTHVIKDVIELPAPMEVSANRRFVPIVAKCNNQVRWLVTSTSGPQIDVLESPLTNMVMIFPRPNTDDTIAILAYTAKGGEPTNAVITFIRVKADKPPPKTDETDETDDPKPPPAGNITKVHVTYLIDFSRQTRAIADIVNDRDLRRWLMERGHKVHELSIRDDLKKLGLDMFIQGKTLPLLVIQTQAETGVKEGQVIFVDTLTSIKQVQEVVTKLTSR